MLRFPAKDRVRPTVHLTALIDIVFLLLVFFLLASSFVEREGVAIIVPEIESSGSDALPRLVVSVDRDGRISVGGVVMDDRRLVDALRLRLGEVADDTVVVNADRRVEYDVVVRAIDAAKMAGAGSILLLTTRRTTGAR